MVAGSFLCVMLSDSDLFRVSFVLKPGEYVACVELSCVCTRLGMQRELANLGRSRRFVALCFSVRSLCRQAA